ncbi:MAG: hypothetical protein FWE94_03830 [Coriobacteriia bacterium]|nr:hypothetical protein [Coriobacteriia bacterium]
MIRRLVVAFFVALLAVTLVGCGGGGGQTEEPAVSEAGEAGAAQPVAPKADPNAGVAANRSDLWKEYTEPNPFLRGSDGKDISKEDIPDAVVKRLESGKAMMLFFYHSDRPETRHPEYYPAAQYPVTDDLRSQVATVATANRGLIDLLTYDLGTAVKLNEDGKVTVNEKPLENDKNDKSPQAAIAVRFARAIGVDHVPYILIIDEKGNTIFWSRGFIDKELLERQVQRVSS